MSDTENGASSTSPQSGRRRTRIGTRIAAGSLVLSLLFLGALAIIVATNLGDEDPPDDADLRIEIPAIARKDDAGPPIRRALRSLRGWALWSETTAEGTPLPDALADAGFLSFTPGAPDGPGTAEEWASSPLSGPVEGVLERHAEFFAAVEEALERPRLSMPAPVSPLDGIDDWFGPAHEGWQLLTLRSDAAFARVDVDATLRADLTLLRYADRFVDGARSLLHTLAAFAQLGDALAAVEHHLASGTLAGHEPELRAALAEIEVDFTHASRAARCEYALLRDTVEDVPRLLEENKLPSGELGTYLFQPNATLRLASEYYRAVIAEGEATGRVQHVRLPVDPDSGVGLIFGGNPVGKLLLRMIVVAPDRAYLKSGEVAAALAAVRTLVALSAFERENGALPDTLDALVPTYLDAIPRDPWDGAPLRYDRERRLVWAIGPDGVDEGGSGEPVLGVGDRGTDRVHRIPTAVSDR